MLLYSPAEARICLCLDLMLVTGEAVYSIKKSVPHKSRLTCINNHTVNSDYPMCITCVAGDCTTVQDTESTDTCAVVLADQPK